LNHPRFCKGCGCKHGGHRPSLEPPLREDASRACHRQEHPESMGHQSCGMGRRWKCLQKGAHVFRAVDQRSGDLRCQEVLRGLA